jgi:DNA-binding GntR family transcriptional regulator
MVPSISIEELEELFIISSRMEGLAAFQACHRLVEEDLVKLQRLHQEMTRSSKAKHTQRWLAANEQFHHFIFRGSRNKQLEQLLFGLWRRGIRRRTEAPRVPGHMERRNAEHAAIIAAFEQRNAGLVERLWRDHMLASGEEIIKSLNEARIQESTLKRSR